MVEHMYKGLGTNRTYGPTGSRSSNKSQGDVQVGQQNNHQAPANVHLDKRTWGTKLKVMWNFKRYNPQVGRRRLAAYF